jgi:hypothetical protein
MTIECESLKRDDGPKVELQADAPTTTVSHPIAPVVEMLAKPARPVAQTVVSTPRLTPPMCAQQPDLPAVTAPFHRVPGGRRYHLCHWLGDVTPVTESVVTTDSAAGISHYGRRSLGYSDPAFTIIWPSRLPSAGPSRRRNLPARLRNAPQHRRAQSKWAIAAGTPQDDIHAWSAICRSILIYRCPHSRIIAAKVPPISSGSRKIERCRNFDRGRHLQGNCAKRCHCIEVPEIPSAP